MEPLRDDLRTAAQAGLDRFEIPGAVVGVLSDGQIQVSSFGVVSLETGFPVRPDTAFQIGSVTKPYTASLVMALVERGLIHLDEPVRKHLPDLTLADEAAAQMITPRMLLNHTGGFWGDWFADFGLGDDAMQRFVDRYDQLHQLTPPGTHWTYNNCGYILAGHLAAQVLDTTFDDALRREVLEPLGASRTFLSAAEAIAYPVAVGHLYSEHGHTHSVAHQYLRPRCRNPAGGVVATASDVLRFARMHLEPKDGSLSAETVRQMHEPSIETYERGVSWGLGFSVEKRRGGTVVGHSGSTNGFQALLEMVPAQGLAVVVLTNSDRGGAACREIASSVLEELAGITPVDHPTVDVEPEWLEQLAGIYDQPYASMEVRVRDDRLEARYQSRSPYSEAGEEPFTSWEGLRPIAHDTFMFIDGDASGSQVRFWFDDRGAVRFAQSGGRLYLPQQ